MRKQQKEKIELLKDDLFHFLKLHWKTLSASISKTFYKDDDEFHFVMDFAVVGNLNKDDVDRDFTNVVVEEQLTNDFAEYDISYLQNIKFNDDARIAKYGEYYTVIRIVIKNITK